MVVVLRLASVQLLEVLAVSATTSTVPQVAEAKATPTVHSVKVAQAVIVIIQASKSEVVQAAQATGSAQAASQALEVGGLTVKCPTVVLAVSQAQPSSETATSHGQTQEQDTELSNHDYNSIHIRSDGGE